MIIKNFLLLLYLISNCLCVHVQLPLTKETEQYYELEQLEHDYGLAPENLGVIFYTQYIGVKEGIIIKEVSYKGVTLFKEDDDVRPEAQRTLVFSTLAGRTFIGIFLEDLTQKFEKAFYIANSNIYDLTMVKTLVDPKDRMIQGKTPGTYVTQMFRKIPPKNLGEKAEGAAAEEEDPFIPEDVVLFDIDVIFAKRFEDEFNPVVPD